MNSHLLYWWKDSAVFSRLRGLEERLRFERAELRFVNLPPAAEPFYDATMGPFDRFPYHWLTLVDADGVTGSAPCWGDPKGLLRRLVGGTARTYIEWYHELYWSIRNRGFRSEAACELAAVDAAMQDILAKRAGLPLHRFWGAERSEVDVYASGGSTHFTDKQLVEEMTSFVEAGFTALKMKVGTRFGTEMERDVERVRAVRRAVGPSVRLAVDANQCWTADQALEFARRVAEYDIAWFEEPVHSADLKAHEQVAASSPIPIAAGESVRTYFDFERLIEAGVQHLQPAPHVLPGIVEWGMTRDAAERRGLELTSGGFTPYTAAFCATTRSGWVEYLVQLIRPFVESLAGPPIIRNGVYRLPEAPGLGIEPDWERLEKLGLVETWSA